jgi:2,3-dihydroxybiphenyl 1,2-dioxygenase
MKLKGLGYIGVNAASVDAWRPFASGVLGLMPVDPPVGASGVPPDTLWLKMDQRHWRIAVHPSDHDGLAYVGWEVGDQASFAAALKELDAGGVAVKLLDDAERQTRAVKGLARFQDPFGHTHELFWGPAVDEFPFVSPEGVSGFLTEGVGVGHVLFTVSNSWEAADFYTGMLGFKLTDWFTWGPNSAVFLHTTPRHHSAAFVDLELPTGLGLNHFMIEANTLVDVGRAYDRAMAAKVPIVNSLGQHINDPMLSFYMQSPSGFNVEFGCAGLMIDDEDAWTPKEWSGRGEIWGHTGVFMDNIQAAKTE